MTRLDSVIFWLADQTNETEYLKNVYSRNRKTLREVFLVVKSSPEYSDLRIFQRSKPLNLSEGGKVKLTKLQEKLAQLPSFDMQKVQGSLWSYSNLSPRLI